MVFTPRTPRILLVALLLSGAACGGGIVEGAACDDNTCGTGLTCRAGTCVRLCNNRSDCVGSGEVCLDGVCGPCPEGQCAAPASPTAVSASDGTSAAHVRVTWTAVAGTATYRVLRDGTAIAEGLSSAEYLDDEAEAGLPSAEGLAPTATGGPSAIRITWGAATERDGATHSYTVVATNLSGDSAPSSADDGHRGAAPITGYAVEVGTTWVDVGAVLQHDDDTAPAATITAGTVSASDGTSATAVELSITGSSTAPGASTSYRVRAMTSVGPGEASEAASGARTVGALTYQWQRSAADSDAAYSDIFGATTALFTDTDPPADGSGRHWRARLRAQGAVEVFSAADRGYVLLGLPTLGAPSVVQLRADRVRVSADLLDLGEGDAVSSYGCCVGPTPQTGLGGADECVELGTIATAGNMECDFGDLEVAATYYTRAYAANSAGTAYSAATSFATIVPAPTGLSASDGSLADMVLLSWDAVPLADSYTVRRDGSIIGVVSIADFEDTGAAAGLPSAEGFALAATAGDNTDYVDVAWLPPDLTDGADHTYTVSAAVGSVDSLESDSDTGYRAGSPVDRYEVEINGVWVDQGSALSLQDATAPAPSLAVGAVSASDGTSSAHVTLEAEITTTDGAAATYRVRALSAAGTGPASPDVSGYRGAGPVSQFWQRSADDSAAGFGDILGASSNPYDDTGAPSDGSGRYYRVVASAAGMTVYSGHDRGHREPSRTFTSTHYTHANTNGHAVMPSGGISAAIYDYDGGLWAGTTTGQVGYFKSDDWTIYDFTNSSLPDGPKTSAPPPIRAIALGAPGSGLWIANQIGIVHFDGATWSEPRTQTTDPAMPGDFIFDLAVDADGDLWVAFISSVAKLSGDTWTNYPNGVNGPAAMSRSIIALDDEIWVGTTAGLSRFDPAGPTWTTYHTGNSGLGSNNIYDVAAYGSQILIATFGDGLNILNPSMGMFTRYNTGNSGIGDNNSRTVATDGSTIYVGGYSNGISFYNGAAWTTYNANLGLAGTGVYAIAPIGSEVSVGFDTECAYISHWDGAWSTWRPGEAGLATDVVSDVRAQPAGVTWINTMDGSSQFSAGSWVTYTQRNSGLDYWDNYYARMVTSSAELSTGELLFGTIYYGAPHWHPSTGWSTINAPPLGGSSVSDILEDPVTGDVWFAHTLGGGLTRWDGASGYTTLGATPGGLVDGTVNGLALDASRNLWIATAGGVSRYNIDDTTWTSFTNATGDLPADYVMHVAVDGDNVWFGTTSGLVRVTMPGETWNTFTTADGLSSDVVWSIAVDGRGGVWAGTNDGLNLYDSAGFTVYRTTNSDLRSDFISTVSAIGDEIWVGSFGRGVSRLVRD